jgi:hypothetical protein
MRSPIDAGLAPGPTRILPPWLLASATGLLIGALLLRFDYTTAEFESPEYTPHAAGYSSAPSLVTDPFAPAASLAAPPKAPPAPLALAPAASDPRGGEIPAPPDTP